MAFPDIHPALARALASQGYEEPTPVQAAVLTEEAEGRDLLVSAQTGSGKTVAFGLAAGPTLLGEEQWVGQAGPPLALAIAPTRELAMQVARAWYQATSAELDRLRERHPDIPHITSLPEAINKLKSIV